MRTFHILPIILIGMTCQAAAQTIADATRANPPAIGDRDVDRVATRPAATPACGLWLEGCLREDSGRLLLFLGVLGAGRLSLVRR